MLKEFTPLTPAEQQAMFDAVPLITILVAGADGDMDEREISEAKRLADIRSYDNHGRLQAFYEIIDDTMPARIEAMAAELPQDTDARQRAISERLAQLNGILAKLKLPFGYLYYQSFRSFSRFVAEAHGGFMRFMTVGPEEAKVVDLPMLDAVAKPDENDFPDLP